MYFVFWLTRAFCLCWFHLRWENHKSGVHLGGLSCRTKCPSITNLCSSHSWFSAIIQIPIQKSYKLLADGTSLMLTSWLAYKQSRPFTTLFNFMSEFYRIKELENKIDIPSKIIQMICSIFSVSAVTVSLNLISQANKCVTITWVLPCL